MFGRFNRTFIVTLLLTLGCKEQTAHVQDPSPGTVVTPTDAVALLNDKTPKEDPFCLNAIGRDGKKLTVGRAIPSLVKDEVGRFYFGVFNEWTDITGTRNVTLKPTFFPDPAAAVQAATEMGVSQFEVCPKFGVM